MNGLYRGRIHHIQPGPPSGNLDADIIFAEYQEQASAGQLAFRRWPLRSVSLSSNDMRSQSDGSSINVYLPSLQRSMSLLPHSTLY